MHRPKLNLILHLIGQLVAQTAVLEIVPPQYKPYFTAFVGSVGVLIAFVDQSLSLK